MNTLAECVKRPDMTVPYLLMSSYLYYCKDQSSPVSDYEFDLLCNYAAQNWNTITHPHKHLIKKSWLAAGSLYKLREDEYPLMTRGAAWSWLDGRLKPTIPDLLIRIAQAVERFL